jgi:thiamine biosynthesis lipoprotein
MTGTRTWSAWSCTVRLVIDNDRHLDAACAELAAILDRVDAAASRFRADSTLSYANAHSGRPVVISRVLLDLLDAALTAAEQSGGAVDPTVGANVMAAGYDRDISDVAPNGPATELPVIPPGWRRVRLDREAGLLTVPAGTALDLGATAKAYTPDFAARTLSQRFGSGVLVEIGGDLAVAGEHADGWAIRVAEAEDGAGPTVVLHDGGMATSTTTIRTWTRGGHRLHHIIDPATGAPAQGCWRTATVAASSALEANTASTTAIVLGSDAKAWLEARDLAARLVHRSGHVTTTTGWPARDGVARERLVSR